MSVGGRVGHGECGREGGTRCVWEGGWDTVSVGGRVGHGECEREDGTR